MASFLDSDIWYSFTRSWITMLAALITLVLIVSAIFAHQIAPNDPFNLESLSLLDGSKPPLWSADGEWRFPLGTDQQGRCVLSSILFGMRISLIVGFLGVLLAASIGITLGLVAGYLGGTVDSVIMRIADVQLTFPAILIALLIDGTMRALVGTARSEVLVFWVLVVSIGLSFWVQYARTVRGSTMVERNKEYVQAARLIGLGKITILFRHVLPNVVGPVLVIATINMALAIMPPTEPSLGTLIRLGNEFLFSGEWWVVIFPGLTLAILVLAINLLGDWLRDALNPKLR
ncbi:MAG: ABC transporter permease [Hyphomicrobiales bacterium]|nr:ABC transporter permease [Hyphomicrobiales bacterium]